MIPFMNMNPNLISIWHMPLRRAAHTHGRLYNKPIQVSSNSSILSNQKVKKLREFNMRNNHKS